MRIYYSEAVIAGVAWDVVMSRENATDEWGVFMAILPSERVELDTGDVFAAAWPKNKSHPFWSEVGARTTRTARRWHTERQDELGIGVAAMARVPMFSDRFAHCLLASKGAGGHRARPNFFGDDAASAWAERMKERMSWGTPRPGSYEKVDWTRVNVPPFWGRGAAPPTPRSPGPHADAYSVLGLTPEASRDDVLAAHKKLAKENHPDRGGDGARLAEINVARDKILGTGVGAPRRGSAS